jgi:hypothetical protein
MFHRAITQAIADFANDFATRPFDYLFEADVQADLHGRLRRVLEADPVDLKEIRDRQLFGVTDLKVSRVHAEYPTSKRFDIALIAASDRSASMWNQPVGAAVEIKLWQADGTGGGINEDLRKLHERNSNLGSLGFLGVVLIAGHPGKDVATVGALDDRTPKLERTDGPAECGVFVCAVDSGDTIPRVRWWRSTLAPEWHQD